MFKMKRKSHASIIVNDYVIRALVSNGPLLDQPVIYEIPLPRNAVQEGSIMDEMAIYDLIKENVPNWGGKKQNVRFLVPRQAV